MSTRNKYVLLPAAALFLTPFPGVAQTFTESLMSGKASVNERLRYEHVDDEAFEGKAEAMTIRSRVGYQTAPFAGFSALIEFEDIRALGGMDDYQVPPPPAAPATGSAIIADPEQTELNRAQLRYSGVEKLDLILGRQRLMFDNQRFIGTVGFRQDEQTFDAFSAAYTGLPGWNFTYAYVDRVKGITDSFNADVSDALLNLSYSGFSFGKIIAYSYKLKNQEENQLLINPALRYASNETVGMRFDGAYALSKPLKVLYRAEYAEQEVDLTTGMSFDTEYTLLEGGLGWSFGEGAYGLTAILGMESLGADDSQRVGNTDAGLYAFQTPYATKHAFNGWVDQFLATPSQGLVDTYLSVGFDLNSYATKILLTYRTFESDVDAAALGDTLDLGEETNIQIIKVLSPQWTVGAKYGDYTQAGDADVAVSGKRNSDKVWAWVELNF